MLGGESNFVYLKTNIGKYFKPTNLPQILAEKKKKDEVRIFIKSWLISLSQFMKKSSCSLVFKTCEQMLITIQGARFSTSIKY